MKATISLPDDLFSAANTLAKRMGMSRNALLSTAIAEFLAKHTESEATARLDRLYVSEPSALDPAIRRAQGRSLQSNPW